MFGDILKKLRKTAHITQVQLAAELSLDKSSIAKYESAGVTPSPDVLKSMAKFFNVSIDYLLGNTCDPATAGNCVRIPIIGISAAGLPVEQMHIDENDPDTWEEISKDMAATGDYVAVRLKGDSMSPRIESGDIVIVRVQDTVENGATAIIIINDDEATCKRVKLSDAGIVLISNNPAYDPIVYTPQEIETLPVRIYGKVVELRGKYE